MTSLFAAVVVAALVVVAAAQVGQDPQRQGGIGSKCGNDRECSFDHSRCYFNTCSCSNSYTVFEGRCVRKVGDSCADDGHCDAEGAECDPERQSCQCGDGMTATGNGTYCYKTPSQQGDFCTRHTDCLFLGESAGCVDGRCGCRDATFVAHDNLCKFKIDQLGVECNPRTNVCYLEKDGDQQHVECINSQCQCSAGYAESDDKQSCNKGTLLAVSLESVLFIVMAKIFA